jgi:hypothetical protein
LGRYFADPGIDRIAMFDHGGDQFAGKCRGGRVALGLGQVPFEDGLRSPLAEVGLEDSGERESTSRRTTSASAARRATSASTAALSISLRRHRR